LKNLLVALTAPILLVELAVRLSLALLYAYRVRGWTPAWWRYAWR
jgi:hypothetical protein